MIRPFLLLLALAPTLFAASKPNIVVLLADDHSAADMSVYGAKDIPTPHLDRMAASGMVFEKAFVNSPSCAPSRAALFTGLYPARNGAEPNHTKPRADIKRLPAYLKELGYEVVSFGKTSHYAHVLDQGFDSAMGYTMHDHTCVRASIDFLKTRKSDKPLALFFGTHWPHVPLPEPEGIDPAMVRIRPMHIDTPEFRHYRARYLNAVRKMDEEIGTVYEAAKAALGTENTFFLQTADHGAQLPFGKWNLYDEGTRVPLIVQWQGRIAAGTRTAAMAQWIDILPTLIEVGGGQAPADLDGRSLIPVLSGAVPEHREVIFTTHTGDGTKNVYPCRSVRTQRWHYLRNLHPEFRYCTHIDRVPGNERNYWLSWEKAAETDPQAAKIVARYRQRPAEELYDLESDPFELNNLATDPSHATRLKEMGRALDAWMKSTGDTQMIAGEPSLLTEPFTMIEPATKKQGTLKANADLQGDAAPDIANRAFTVAVRVEKPGTEGVLVAQGGQANGWALFVRDGKLRFTMNRDNERMELASDDPAWKSAKELKATVGPKAWVKLFADGKEIARESFGALLPSQPIDGLQVGRDLAASVGGYKVPFAFNGVIASATLDLGERVASPPAARTSVPAGGPVPKLNVPEQRQHPDPALDRFGGFKAVRREATGFFRVEQINGRWFFITPEGHPFIAIGPNHTGPTLRQQGKDSGLWARFGNDPERVAAEMLKIIHDLGFTAGDVYQPESTYTRTLPWITFFWYGPANHTFVDVFDEAAMADVTRRAFAHAQSVADNPWVLGIGGPDLQVWDWKLVRKYRELPPQSAGRRRYAAFARERYAGDIARFNAVYRTSFASFDDLAAPPKLTLPADAEDDLLDAWTLRWKLTVPPEKSANPAMQADNDAFCALVAETLFPQVRAAVKRGAPNHLFLGEHLAVRMIPDAVIQAMAPHIDGYLAQAVEVSPQRPPEWQVFQRDRWDHEYALLRKPIVIVDWGAVFSHGDAFAYQGATIKPEREASDDAAKFITDAFDAPYIIGLFLCKLLGGHRNDTNFFQDRATRCYLKPDGTAFSYRTEALKQANINALKTTYERIAEQAAKPKKP